MVKSNLEENAEKKKEQKRQEQLPQAAVLPPPNPLDVAAAAYNASPIKLEGNNKVFADRPLYRVDVTMSSTVDEEIGLGMKMNHTFARLETNGIHNSSCLYDQFPSVFHEGYVIVATEACGDACQSITPHKHVDMLNKACNTTDRSAW